MAKRVPRPRRRRAARRSHTPAPRHAPNTRSLIDRLLDMPHLAHVVPRLPSEALHRVIENCGLEACGDLVALATPAQLTRVFDLDLWKPAQPGLDEQFDADRFGLWLEVMLETGDSVAARTVAGLDTRLVVVGLSRYLRVFDPGTFEPTGSSDDEPADRHELMNGETSGDALECEVGGYLVRARRTDAWDAIVTLLITLESEHTHYFRAVMQGCRRLSHSRPEIDGLDDLLLEPEQHLFDVALERERRRDRQGYMTPAQARAFLQMSRQVRRGRDVTPAANPIARAYFQALEWTPEAGADAGAPRVTAGSDAPSAAADSADAFTAVVDVLRDAGILPGQPRALLDGPQGPAPRLGRIQALMQIASERDPIAFSTRGQELAFLANTMAAGCSIQARAFTPQEATDAAVATCNLGLENWPPGAALPDDFLVEHDLVSVFEVGWTVLYEDVCLYAAEQLIGILSRLRCEDRETQAGFDALRLEMRKHRHDGAPWRARDALDVMTTVDMPAWAALLGLIDECPVMHAGLDVARNPRARQVSATAFAFISENSQIASVRAFMRGLPDTLSR